MDSTGFILLSLNKGQSAIYEKQGINSVTPARLIQSRYIEFSGLCGVTQLV